MYATMYARYEPGKRYKIGNVELPCYVRGTAYDELLLDDGDHRGGGGDRGARCTKLSPETMALLETGGNLSVACSYDVSSIDRIYRDRAVKLTKREIEAMPIKGGPVEEDHSRLEKKGTVGVISNVWTEANKMKIEAEIHDPEVATRARSGELKGFSVRYTVSRVGDEVTGKSFREISVCRNPVFPGCSIDVCASRTEVGGGTVLDGRTGTGFAIDSVSDSPLDSANKKSNGNISSMQGKRKNAKGPMTEHVSFTQSSGNAQNVTPAPLETQHQHQQQQQQQQQPGKSAQRDDVDMEGRDDADFDKDSAKRQKIAMKDAVKAEKYKELKKRDRERQAQDNQRKAEHLANAEPKKNAFVKKYVEQLGRQPTEYELGIITNSFGDPDIASWAEGLSTMVQNITALEETNANLKQEKERLIEEANALRRKAEKAKKASKYMRGTSGQRVPTDYGKEPKSADPVASRVATVLNVKRSASAAGIGSGKTPAYIGKMFASPAASSTVEVAASRAGNGGRASSSSSSFSDTTILGNMDNSFREQLLGFSSVDLGDPLKYMSNYSKDANELTPTSLRYGYASISELETA